MSKKEHVFFSFRMIERIGHPIVDPVVFFESRKIHGWSTYPLLTYPSEIRG